MDGRNRPEFHLFPSIIARRTLPSPPLLARSLPLVTQANHHKSSFVPLVPISPARNAHFCLPIETFNDDWTEIELDWSHSSYLFWALEISNRGHTGCLYMVRQEQGTIYRVTTIDVSRKWIEWAEWASSLCTANSPFPGHVYCRHPVYQTMQKP